MFLFPIKSNVLFGSFNPAAIWDFLSMSSNGLFFSEVKLNEVLHH
jgi:hypothetical protein